MKNIVYIIVVLIAGGFLIARFMPDALKPSKTIIDAGNQLKADEDKSKEAAVTANRTIVQSAVNSFRGMENRFPSSLQELVDRKYMDRIPSTPLKYNPETGEVSGE